MTCLFIYLSIHLSIHPSIYLFIHYLSISIRRFTIRSGSCRRKWQPIPVFLSGKSHGQRSLAGYSPGDCKKADTIEHTQTYIVFTFLMYTTFTLVLPSHFPTSIPSKHLGTKQALSWSQFNSGLLPKGCTNDRHISVAESQKQQATI